MVIDPLTNMPKEVVSLEGKNQAAAFMRDAMTRVAGGGNITSSDVFALQERYKKKGVATAPVDFMEASQIRTVKDVDETLKAISIRNKKGLITDPAQRERERDRVQGLIERRKKLEADEKMKLDTGSPQFGKPIKEESR